MINYDCPTPYQFLLGTVQPGSFIKSSWYDTCQFLLGTVQREIFRNPKNYACQFLLGTVQLSYYYWYSIIFFSEIQPFFFQKVRRPIFLPGTYCFHVIQCLQSFYQIKTVLILGRRTFFIHMNVPYSNSYIMSIIKTSKYFFQFS